MDAAVLAFLAILGALTLGAMSPGPSFVLVSHRSIALSRRDGLAAALGMGVGAVGFGLAAFFGLQVVLLAIPGLYLALKLAGGAYLVFLGVRLWIGAGRPLLPPVPDEQPRDARRSFAVALGTQLSNPKTAIVYASIFASLMPDHAPTWFLLALPPCILVVEGGWYTVVALALSAPRPRQAYLRWKKAVDRVAGSALVLLGLRFVVDRTRPA